MWLMTTRGFYSVVQHRDSPLDVMIRARSREDLEALCELPSMEIYSEEILETPPPAADYRFRLPRVNRGNWDHAVLELLTEVDYPNFKDAVTRVGERRRPGLGRARHRIYLKVWSALQRIHDGEAEAEPQKPLAWDEGDLWTDPQGSGWRGD